MKLSDYEVTTKSETLCTGKAFPSIVLPFPEAKQDMSDITPEKVRQFLLARYFETIKARGIDPVDVPDTFDFLLSGIIDSFGILEMVSSIEDEFHIQLDMAALDAEQITILGPLCQYVAENSNAA
jgi:acyl carrier protein